MSYDSPIQEKKDLWRMINRLNKRIVWFEQRSYELEKQVYENTHKKIEVVPY